MPASGSRPVKTFQTVWKMHPEAKYHSGRSKSKAWLRILVNVAFWLIASRNRATCSSMGSWESFVEDLKYFLRNDVWSSCFSMSGGWDPVRRQDCGVGDARVVLVIYNSRDSLTCMYSVYVCPERVPRKPDRVVRSPGLTEKARQKLLAVLAQHDHLQQSPTREQGRGHQKE